MKTCNMIHLCVPESKRGDKETLKQTRKEIQNRCGQHSGGHSYCCLTRMAVVIGGVSDEL